jgi:hypothetical protein
MKTSVYFIIVLSLITNSLSAQSGNAEPFFTVKPKDIKAKETGIQKYDVTLKWQNLEALEGKRINCSAIKATYVMGLENDSAGWRKVSLAQINDFQQKEFKGADVTALGGFTYKLNETNFLNEDFYNPIPPEQRDLAKWLVSDAIQVQGLARYYFDSLEYNKEFFPKYLENKDIAFENWVTFTSRYQKLIWSGIALYHHQICAVVKFESYNNPVRIDNEQMSVKGRSLYYGEMWISFENKQVEYAFMFEDVLMNLKSSLFPQEQLINLQREIVFNKVK